MEVTNKIKKEQQKKINMCLKLNKYQMFIMVTITCYGA